MNERLQESEVTKKNKDPITVTDRALDRIRYLLDQKNNAQARDEGYEPDDQEDEGYEFDDQEDEFENDSWKIKKAIGVRVLIKQKGCSGLKYDIEYAYDIRPLESVIEKSCSDGQKIKVLIDPKSVMFILGSEMDYIEEKLSSGFVFKNPNEKGKCGCGESFHV